MLNKTKTLSRSSPSNPPDLYFLSIFVTILYIIHIILLRQVGLPYMLCLMRRHLRVVIIYFLLYLFLNY